MPMRVRKLVGTGLILAFLTLWLWGAVSLREQLPSGHAVDLIWYAAAGLLWGVPLYPLFKWMNRGG